MDTETETEFRITKIVKWAIQQSTFACPSCDGGGKDREHFFTPHEGMQVREIDAPCKHCDGRGYHAPDWYDGGVVAAVNGHAVGFALGRIDRGDVHGATLELQGAQEFALRAVEFQRKKDPKGFEDFERALSSYFSET